MISFHFEQLLVTITTNRAGLNSVSSHYICIVHDQQLLMNITHTMIAHSRSTTDISHTPVMNIANR